MKTVETQACCRDASLATRHMLLRCLWPHSKAPRAKTQLFAPVPSAGMPPRKQAQKHPGTNAAAQARGVRASFSEKLIMDVAPAESFQRSRQWTSKRSRKPRDTRFSEIQKKSSLAGDGGDSIPRWSGTDIDDETSTSSAERTTLFTASTYRTWSSKRSRRKDGRFDKALAKAAGRPGKTTAGQVAAARW